MDTMDKIKKKDKKRLYRQYGGDADHIKSLIQSRQERLNNWIGIMGGFERVAHWHKSALVGTTPRKKGQVTSPENPYRGCLVQEYENFYLVYVPPKRGELFRSVRSGLDTFTHKMGGVKPGKIGWALPKSSPLVGEFIRRLSVVWG